MTEGKFDFILLKIKIPKGCISILFLSRKIPKILFYSLIMKTNLKGEKNFMLIHVNIRKIYLLLFLLNFEFVKNLK